MLIDLNYAHDAFLNVCTPIDAINYYIFGLNYINIRVLSHILWNEIEFKSIGASLTKHASFLEICI